MITEIIRYNLAESQRELFVAQYQKAMALVESSGFAQDWEILQQVENPDLFQIIIRWKSVEAHMEGFRRAPEFGDFFALVKPYFNQILEMQHYAKR